MSKDIIYSLVTDKNFSKEIDKNLEIIDYDKEINNKTEHYIDNSIFKLLLPISSYIFLKETYDGKLKFAELIDKSSGNYLPLIVDLKFNFKKSSEDIDTDIDKLTRNASFISSLTSKTNQVLKSLTISGISGDVIEDEELLYVPAVFTCVFSESQIVTYRIQLRYYYIRFNFLSDPNNEIFQRISNKFEKNSFEFNSLTNLKFNECIFDKLIFKNKFFNFYETYLEPQDSLTYLGCFTEDNSIVEHGVYFRREHHELYNTKINNKIKNIDSKLSDLLIILGNKDDDSDIDNFVQDTFENEDKPNYILNYFFSLRYLSKNKFSIEEVKAPTSPDEIYDEEWVQKDGIEKILKSPNKAAIVRNLMRIIDKSRIINEIYFYKIGYIIYDAYTNNSKIDEIPFKDKNSEEGFNYWISLIMNVLEFTTHEQFNSYHHDKMKIINGLKSKLEKILKYELDKKENNDKLNFENKEFEKIKNEYKEKSLIDKKPFDDENFILNDRDLNRLKISVDNQLKKNRKVNISLFERENKEIRELNLEIISNSYILDFIKCKEREYLTIEKLKQIYYSFDQETILRDFRSLIHYSRIDNKQLYKKWHRSFYAGHMSNALLYPNDKSELAFSFYLVYITDFNYAGGTGIGKGWYTLKEESHIWRYEGNTDQCTPIEKLLSDEFRDFILDYLNYEYSQVRMLNENSEEYRLQFEIYRKKKSNYDNILRDRLGSDNGTYTKKIKVRFEDLNFTKYIDSNNKIFSVKNGVIDILKDKAEFRKGDPQDYVTKTSTIKYNPSLNFNDPNVIDFMEWMEKCFVDYHYDQDNNGKLKLRYTDRDLMDYFLVVCSSFLEGGNKDKKIFFFFGPRGHNSKSAVVALLELIFGSYFCKSPESTFMSKGFNNSGNADPSDARTKNTRINCIDETREDTTFEKNEVKKKTGNDSRYTRGLYSEGEDIKQTSKYIVSTNAIPNIKDPDEALIERICLIPFKSVWSEYADSDIDIQRKNRCYKRIFEFNDIIKDYGCVALFVFVQYYSRYAKYGIGNPPPVIIDEINNYVSKIDRYIIFIDLFIDVGTKDDYLLISEAYQEFKIWYENFYKVKDIPTCDIFSTSMEQKLEIMSFSKRENNKSGFWKGIKLKKSKAKTATFNLA